MPLGPRQEYVETTSAVYYLGKIQVIIIVAIIAITRTIISMNIRKTVLFRQQRRNNQSILNSPHYIKIFWT